MLPLEVRGAARRMMATGHGFGKTGPGSSPAAGQTQCQPKKNKPKKHQKKHLLKKHPPKKHQLKKCKPKKHQKKHPPKIKKNNYS